MPPFVLNLAGATNCEQIGSIDIYRPVAVDAVDRPLIVFVHGGPRPPAAPPARDAPVYIGYGTLAAEHGAVGVVMEHHMHSYADCSATVSKIEAAIAQARALPGVDASRVGLWFFSGSGILSAGWLRNPPDWLVCLALTYPVLDPLPEWEVDDRYRPSTTELATDLPIVLTRVGLERPDFASGVNAFVDNARAADVHLDVIDVPNGQHGFDMLDHTNESRVAVRAAMTTVTDHLSRSN